MLWFKSKDTNATCPPSEVCNTMDCRLADLRSNQAAQKQIRERINVLTNKYFPMVYWWIVVCQKIGSHYFLNSRNICRGYIENTLKITLRELKADSKFFPQGLNKDQFDVDQFCQEMKDYFTTDQQIAELNKELTQLQESEKNLKKILGIK